MLKGFPLVTRVQRSLRYKLLMLVLFPIILVMPITLGLAVYWSDKATYDQLFIKVDTDLAVAQDVFARIRADYLATLARIGESYLFRSNLADHDSRAIQAQLDDMARRQGFVYLRMVDLDGLNPSAPEQTFAGGFRLPGELARALAGEAVSGVQVLGPDELAGIAPELPAIIRLPLVETPRALPTQRTFEDRAMAMRMVYPVADIGGRVVALLDGAVLLNGNFPFVDTIRDLVYGPGSLPEGSIGTVTVFLDDVRISTNVPVRPGERALGTRVSAEVRAQVLEQGDRWVNRAFVVNDWYVSGYEPIYDVVGKRVGMLYAGFLEAPFRASLVRTIQLISLLFLAFMGFSATLAFYGAKSIFRPIEKMSAVVRATRVGEDRRIGSLASRDEIGELAREFDVVLDLLQERNRQIQRAAGELELKVDQRTRELREKNADLETTVALLQQTRQQLLVAAKLAAVGELTAGVAHEINNPTAVILGNLDLLVSELGPAIEPVSEEVELIVAQVYRIREIINNLLQYARPAEYAGYINDISIDEVITDTLGLVAHAIKHGSVEVTTSIRTERGIAINRQELQQVLVNLMVNACHAVSDKRGRIEIRAEDWDERGVVISVRDNGPGIPSHVCLRLFDPFFTTKPEGQGTGLGLSISYGLIRRYGGNITVSSRLGAGAEFKVWLLSDPILDEDEQAIMDRVRTTGSA